MSKTHRKRCPMCGRTLPLDMFSKGNSTHGKHTYCKACDSLRIRHRRHALKMNRDEGRELTAEEKALIEQAKEHVKKPEQGHS